MMWKMPGLADHFPGVVGQKIALAGHHRRGDRAGLAADDLIDPQRQRIAAAVERHQRRVDKAGRAQRRDDLDAAKDIADRADAREPGIAREVVTARQTSCAGGSSRAFSRT